MEDKIEELSRILDRLIRFPTTPDESNIDMIDWLANRLEDTGAQIDVLPDAENRFANLLARIGPERPGGIILSGHTDVVTVKDQHWNTDPFALTQQSGRLYGRGTADMKGFLALMLANASHFASLPLTRPIYLTFTYGEESGCIGAPALVEHFVGTQPKPTLAIVGEPTELRPVTHHKAMALFRTEIIGKEAHSSRPDLGASANLAAMGLIAFLGNYFANLRKRFQDDELFEPPYSTFNIGRLSGGIATSFIANHCLIDWEFRTLPGISVDQILRDIQTHIDEEVLPTLCEGFSDSQIRLNCWARVPGLANMTDPAALSAIEFLTGQNQSRAVSYGTEAGIFQTAGIPAVLCGPGNISEAHRANEFVSIEQLIAGDTFLNGVGGWAVAPVDT